MKRSILLLTLIGFVFAAAACGPERDESGALTESQDVSASDVAVGDCFNADTGGAISDVGGVPCDEPHVYEVFALATHEDGDFPGDAEIQTKAEELCVAEYEGYVGATYEESEFVLTTINPSQETWDTGDRVTICALSAEGETEITGSQRDSGK